ncbi:hypothetical protein [Methanocella arvoryzae]|nr:hypothetical protein [Methanocella arvoryzae]
MAANARLSRKVHIGGTIDRDVADWLERTKGKEKFSTHLNNVLRQAMEAGTTSEERVLQSFQGTLSNIEGKINALQDRLKTIESGAKQVRPEVKRGRGRPRKIKAVDHVRIGGKEVDTLATEYDVQSDINWYLSHDKYKKIKPEPLVNAFDFVVGKFDTGKPITIKTIEEGYDRGQIGVPFPTFRLFYFPLIRDRLMEKKIIEKVEKPGKKGVYQKRT